MKNIPCFEYVDILASLRVNFYEIQVDVDVWNNNYQCVPASSNVAKFSTCSSI
jgi:hypothetical protein